MNLCAFLEKREKLTLEKKDSKQMLALEVSTPNKRNRTLVFKKISDLTECDSVNFIGRVTQYRPPRQIQNGDWLLSFSVADESIVPVDKVELAWIDGGSMLEGLTVLVFGKDARGFPPVKGVGDIIEFFQVRIQYFESKKQAKFGSKSTCTVFHEDPEEGWTANPPRIITPSELLRIHQMDKIFTGKAPLSQPTMITPIFESLNLSQEGKRPLWMIKNIKPSAFFRGIYQILKISTTKHFDMFVYNFWVTDYTSNPLLTFTYDEEGQRFEYPDNCILQVSVWDNFAFIAKELNFSAGDYIYLDNVVGKVVKRSQGESKYLAANVHGDWKAKRPCVAKISRDNPDELPAIRRIQRLKEKLLSQNGVCCWNGFLLDDFGVERPRVLFHTNDDCKFESEILPATKICNGDDEEVEIVDITSVRSHPNINAKFCVQARVKGFFPEDPNQFVRYYCNFCGCTSDLGVFKTTRYCDNCCTDGGGRLIWTFGLILEDGTGDLPVILVDDDAFLFLGRLSPVDLCHPDNWRSLERVEEIFSVLMTPENEFRFGLKSYRISNTEYSNMRYRVFGTSICESRI